LTNGFKGEKENHRFGIYFLKILLACQKNALLCFSNTALIFPLIALIPELILTLSPTVYVAESF